ncbi:glycine receptor subunit alphaZ1-like [Ptychodera flava]|uniref:glycine receptor subunit alphaZ1-like n=1 Tax=Ptychodera flava TaxID=63121 RepID=UPI00396A7C0D
MVQRRCNFNCNAYIVITLVMFLHPKSFAVVGDGRDHEEKTATETGYKSESFGHDDSDDDDHGGAGGEAGSKEDEHDKHDDNATTLFVDQLFNKYDKTMRPGFDGPTCKVRVDVFFSRIDSLAELTMDYGVTLFLRQMWNDPRLKYDHSSQHIPPSASLLDKIWIPDLFFTNEKSAHFHDQTVDNVMLRFYPNGDVLYSMRVSLTLACYMTFTKFPMDVQVCSIQLESYGYSVDEMEFVWKEDAAIQLPHNLHLQQYTLSTNETLRCDKTYYTGTFSCLEARFTFTRALGYYWLSFFIPTILLVILSWVSFWINPQAAPARVSLGTTIILTVTTQAISVHASLPKVSYVTAMDIWMLACLVFVVASLLQYAVVNFYMTCTEQGYMKAKSCHKNAQVAYHRGVNHNNVEVRFMDADLESQAPNPGKEIALKVDKMSRVLFPLAFLIFNAAYWPTTKYAISTASVDDDH